MASIIRICHEADEGDDAVILAVCVPVGEKCWKLFVLPTFWMMRNADNAPCAYHPSFATCEEEHRSLGRAACIRPLAEALGLSISSAGSGCKAGLRHETLYTQRPLKGLKLPQKELGSLEFGL